MKNYLRTAALSRALAILFSSLTLHAHAAITDAADVGGLRTFQDSNTGRIWLDIDNFFNASATAGMTDNQMVAAALAQGFVIANSADIHQLLDTLPLPGNNWTTYAAIIGYGHPRNLIWGIYDDASTSATFDWAYAYQNDYTWQYAPGGDGTTIAAGNPPGDIDLGIWAYRQAPAVPEPETYAMLLAGLSILGFAARRKRTTA